jgi:hypothetical protein
MQIPAKGCRPTPPAGRLHQNFPAFNDGKRLRRQYSRQLHTMRPSTSTSAPVVSCFPASLAPFRGLSRKTRQRSSLYRHHVEKQHPPLRRPQNTAKVKSVSTTAPSPTTVSAGRGNRTPGTEFCTNKCFYAMLRLYAPDYGGDSRLTPGNAGPTIPSVDREFS